MRPAAAAGLDGPPRRTEASVDRLASWLAFWLVSRAGGAPCIAQGGEPPQGVAAINPVMHQEASEEGVHLHSPGPIETGETLKRGPSSVRSAERIVRSIADMFYGFMNVRVHIFDIR